MLSRKREVKIDSGPDGLLCGDSIGCYMHQVVSYEWHELTKHPAVENRVLPLQVASDNVET
jgi:hypothetical protein